MLFAEHNGALSRRMRKVERQISFPDLLPYAFMAAPGIAALKDGSFMAGFQYAGPDLASSGLEELDALNGRVNSILCRFDTDCMFHFNLVRYPSMEHPLGKFPDPTTQLIEVERHQRYVGKGEHTETATYCTFTWRPPTEKQSRISAMFQRNPKRGARQHFATNLGVFRAKMDSLISLFKKQFLTVTEMDDAALVSHIESCIIGKQVNIRAPGNQDLDHYVGRYKFVPGFKPILGDRHIRVIVPSGFPLETTAEVTNALHELEFPYRWSVRFIPMDQHEALKALGTVRRQWLQRKFGGKQFMANASSSASEQTKVNEHALSMVDDADAAILDANEGLVRFGFFSMSIIVSDTDPAVADEKAKAIESLLTEKHFIGRIEDMNAADGLMGSLPGIGHPHVRRPILATQNVADIVATTSIWAGLRKNPCPMEGWKDAPPLITATGTGWTPFRLNLHHGDVGHTMIIGPTGAGKSTLLGLILAQFRRVPRAQVFWFDKGFSSYALTKAVGGEHWSLGEDQLAAAPLAGIADPREAEWAQGFVERILRLNNVEMIPSRRRELAGALRRLATHPVDMRTLSNLRTTVQDSVLRDGMDPYVTPDERAKYLDSATDVIIDAPWITFEMEPLTGLSELTTLPVLDYLIHRINQRLDGRPTIIALDELAPLLSHPVFGPTILDWVLTLRKKNASIILSTPTMSGLVKSANFQTLVESCPTKIFLPNPTARTSSVEDYKLFGMSQQQREVIAGAVPKQHYYYTSPYGNRLFDLTIDDATLAFVGASSKEHIKSIRELTEAFGDRWPAEWLRLRGEHQWADYWLTLKEAA